MDCPTCNSCGRRSAKSGHSYRASAKGMHPSQTRLALPRKLISRSWLPVHHTALLILLQVALTAPPAATVIAFGPPVPLFGHGPDGLFSILPVFVSPIYQNPYTVKSQQTSHPVTTVTSVLRTTAATTAAATPSATSSVTTSAKEVVTSATSLPRNLKMITQAEMKVATTPPTEYSTSNTPIQGERHQTSATRDTGAWKEKPTAGGAEKATPAETAVFIPSSERTPQESSETLELTPLMHNVSDQQLVQKTYNGSNTTSRATPPSISTIASSYEKKIPKIVHSSHDMLKWLVLAVSTIALVSIVCILMICLRSADVKRTKKMCDLIYHAGLAMPGDDPNGPINYMDIAPCSPLAKHWRSRGFSFGSQSYLQGNSTRATPTGTLRKPLYGKDDASRSRSGSAASAVLAKWRSRGKIPGRRVEGDANHGGSTTDIGQSIGCLCHAAGGQHSSDLPCSLPCCDCQEPLPHGCDGCRDGGSCHHMPENYHAIIHSNPMNTLSLPPQAGQSRLDSMFISEDHCRHCPLKCSQAGYNANCARSEHAQCRSRSCSPAPYRGGRHAEEMTAQCNCCECNDVCQSNEELGGDVEVTLPKHRGRTPTREETTDYLISMLAQAHNLAKGMSLDRRFPHSDSFPAVHQSEHSDLSTLTRKGEFDESSGYIGSSPCAPSPYITTISQAVEPRTIRPTPKPDDVAARLQEREHERQEKQQVQPCQHHLGSAKHLKGKESGGYQDSKKNESHILPSDTNNRRSDSTTGRLLVPPHYNYGSLDRNCARQRADMQDFRKTNPALSDSKCYRKASGQTLKDQASSGTSRITQTRASMPTQDSPLGQSGSGMATKERQKMAHHMPSPKPPQLPPRAHRDRREMLSSLPERSNSPAESVKSAQGTQQATTQKSSSFWDRSKRGADRTRPPDIVVPRDSQQPISTAKRIAGRKEVDMGAATTTFATVSTPDQVSKPKQAGWRKSKGVSVASQDYSITISNPYNQVTLGIPPSTENLDVPEYLRKRDEQIRCQAQEHQERAMYVSRPDSSQQQYPGQSASLQRALAAASSINAGQTSQKADVSRQNTNSSSEEQSGNFYYVREGDVTAYPELDSQGLPYLADHVRRYLTAGGGLRQVSMMSLDSFDGNMATSL